MNEKMTGFAIGDCIAVVGGNMLLLFRPNEEELDVSKIWEAVQADAPVTSVVDVLSHGTVGGVPDFALVRRESDRARVLVRGKLRVQVDDILVSAEDVSTWVERTVEGATRATLFGEELPQDRGDYTIGSGVVPAAWLVHDFADPETPGVVSRVMPETDEVADSEALGREADADGVQEEPRDYDDLFGDTQFRSVESAAARAATTEDDLDAALPGSDEAGETDDQSGPVDDVSSDRDDNLTYSVDTTGGIVGGVLAADASSEEAGSEADDMADDITDEDADADDRTVRRPYTQTPTAPAPVMGASPLVHARECPNGHLNPPHAHQCRVCRQEVTSEAVVEARRPPMGVLVLPDGKQFALDRTVVIGRAPTARAGGSQVPGLVAVDGPDISRSHVVVRIEDWSVLVVDLGSANGTTVALPERPPVRLRANDPILIVPGTVITLADEVSIRFEAR